MTHGIGFKLVKCSSQNENPRNLIPILKLHFFIWNQKKSLSPRFKLILPIGTGFDFKVSKELKMKYLKRIITIGYKRAGAGILFPAIVFLVGLMVLVFQIISNISG